MRSSFPLFSLLLASLLLAGSVIPATQAALKKKDSAMHYYDVFLNDGNICRKCRTERIDEEHIRLTNEQGAWTILPLKSFVGIDYHPIIRKLMSHSLHNIGPKGPELVPYAFDNMNDYLCRYCQKEHF